MSSQAALIPPEAREQWLTLAAALAPLGPPPCESQPEAWWPTRQVEEAALRACAGCPAREACLDYATAAKEPEGIWGGLTADDRKALAADLGSEAALTPPPAQHGEERRFAAGCRCQQCRHTHARRVADWRRRRDYAATSKAA